jgi:hypothetical protein
MEKFRKSERLCNFTYREMLFKKGKSFAIYPFRVHYLLLDKNLENIFFKKSPLIFQGSEELQDNKHKEQNPGYPHRKMPANAFSPSR